MEAQLVSLLSGACLLLTSLNPLFPLASSPHTPPHTHIHIQICTRRALDLMEAQLVSLLSGACLLLAHVTRALGTKTDEVKRLEVNLRVLKQQVRACY
jgi:hypothetical protein